MFEFKDEFKTGLDFMDAEHSKLFQLAEETYQLLTDNFIHDKFDYIIELLSELRDYAKTHFKHEEEYMMENGYKKLFSHKVAHNDFVEKLDSFDFNTIDGNQKETLLELLSFLGDWLVNHIMKVDQEVVKELHS